MAVLCSNLNAFRRKTSLIGCYSKQWLWCVAFIFGVGITHSIRVSFFIVIKFVVTQIVVECKLYEWLCENRNKMEKEHAWWQRERGVKQKQWKWKRREREAESNENCVLYYYSVGLWQHLYITNIITMVVIILGYFHGKWGKSIHRIWDWCDNQIDLVFLFKLCVCACVCVSYDILWLLLDCDCVPSKFFGRRRRLVRDDYFLWQVHISEKMKERERKSAKMCCKRHFNLGSLNLQMTTINWPSALPLEKEQTMTS